MHDGNPVSSETRGPVEFTMVLVQLPIWTAHRFIMRFTVIQALTLPLACLMVNYTVTPQATVLVFTWTWIAIVSHKTCRKHRKKQKKKRVTFFSDPNQRSVRGSEQMESCDYTLITGWILFRLFQSPQHSDNPCQYWVVFFSTHKVTVKSINYASQVHYKAVTVGVIKKVNPNIIENAMKTKTSSVL